MSNLSSFLGGGGGGGLTPKFQEFTSSGTFTPSQALIDAGGYIEVFLVGGGGNSNGSYGGSGGETILQQMYLTSTSGISVTIGAGGSNPGNGGNSSFSGSSAGGTDLTAKGGVSSGQQSNALGAGWGAEGGGQSAGNGVLGYGAGGVRDYDGGVWSPKANSGQGAGYFYSGNAGSGYCLVKWYE